MIADRRGVRIIHGANDGFFEVAGATVRRLQGSLVDAFNIPDDAIALANGQRVPSSYELRRDDVLEFVRVHGEKGAGKKNFTEEDLSRLGFAVVGDEAVPIEDAYPDASWDQSRLEAYAKGRLARSGKAERESILQAEKAAVDLYWAGCALKLIRDQKKAERHGAWTEWKREQGIHDTTANDAIRLYENAKTPDALFGMGITAAKERFVYPFKSQGDDDEQDGTPEKKPKKRTKKATGARAGTSSGKPSTDSDDHPEEDDQGDTGADDESPVIEQTRTLTTELEEIAQRLNEIAQDDMGKVDWKEQDLDRFVDAARAVTDGVNNIFYRINNDVLPK